MKIARYIPESPPASRQEEGTQKGFLLGTDAPSEVFSLGAAWEVGAMCFPGELKVPDLEI